MTPQRRKEIDAKFAPKDESKEAKEGGELFTGGEWECSPVLNFSDTLVSYIKSDTGKGIAQLRGCTNGEEKEAEANATLIAQSKNMYYALKDVVSDLFLQIENKRGAQVAANYPSIVRAKDVLKKANSNY